MPSKSQKRDDLTTRLDREPSNLLATRASGPLNPSLVVLQGVDRGETVLLTKTELIMGRDEDCDFIIRDDGISRNHAKIVEEDGRFVIVDMGSTNGIYYREERVERHVLKEGDKVLIGRRTILKFQYQDGLDVNYHEQMYESAVKDGLTGVFNRRHFEERLTSETSFSKRHKTSLSVLILDLDHFKRVNDTFGHQIGDHVLVRVSKEIWETLREEDFFARYGGEEFVVLARNIGSQGAVAMGERIRLIVQDMRVHTPEGMRIPVTLSVGVCTCEDGEIDSGEILVGQADKNLYDAKKNGRNRVVGTTLR